MFRVRVFQHVPFEGLGSIEGWLADRSADIGWTRWYEEPEADPKVEYAHLLIVLGGPMSVNDPLPWLERERSAIRSAIDSDVPVLGICLGAQQIARELGAEVVAAPEREIGWGWVDGNPFADGPFADLFAGRQEVFHWHGEMCELPAGAERLATSSFCGLQAFSHGDKVLALQFHLETTPESAAALVENCGDEITDGPSIMQPEEILNHRDFPGHPLMAALLERLTGRR